MSGFFSGYGRTGAAAGPGPVVDVLPAVRQRVQMTVSCRDADSVPKVPNAGQVVETPGGLVQIMHDGSRVMAGGYHGDWMIEVIRSLRGHHEPQEELLFHHLLGHVRPGTLVVELGCFWAYYTNWYLGAVPGSRAVCVEPNVGNLEVGRRNIALNGRTAEFINALVGEASRPGAPGLESLDMNALLDRIDSSPVEMLHMDVQGAELPFIRSMPRAVEAGLVRFVVVSTHGEAISGSATTHEDCIRELEACGGTILAEHDIAESYSGDGLIVACFQSQDRGIRLPEVSRNHPGQAAAETLLPVGRTDGLTSVQWLRGIQWLRRLGLGRAA